MFWLDALVFIRVINDTKSINLPDWQLRKQMLPVPVSSLKQSSPSLKQHKPPRP